LTEKAVAGYRNILELITINYSRFLRVFVVALSVLMHNASASVICELLTYLLTDVLKVLKERCDNDRTARVLLEQRNRTVAFRTRCRLCRPVKTIVATITGKKLEVIGRKGSVCTRDIQTGSLERRTH